MPTWCLGSNISRKFLEPTQSYPQFSPHPFHIARLVSSACICIAPLPSPRAICTPCVHGMPATFGFFFNNGVASPSTPSRPVENPLPRPHALEFKQAVSSPLVTQSKERWFEKQCEKLFENKLARKLIEECVVIRDPNVDAYKIENYPHGMTHFMADKCAKCRGKRFFFGGGGVLVIGSARCIWQFGRGGRSVSDQWNASRSPEPCFWITLASQLSPGFRHTFSLHTYGSVSGVMHHRSCAHSVSDEGVGSVQRHAFPHVLEVLRSFVYGNPRVVVVVVVAVVILMSAMPSRGTN